MEQVKVTNNLNETLVKRFNSCKWRVPLKESAELLKTDAILNIEGQGIKYGAFKRLSASTKEARRKRGTYPGKILKDTGKGVNSFKTEVKNNMSARVYNTTDYMGLHQTGTRKMPARTIFKFTEANLRAIVQSFGNYIAKILK